MIKIRKDKARMKKIYEIFSPEETKMYIIWSTLANQRRNLAEKMRKNIECEKEYNRWAEENNKIYSEITKEKKYNRLLDLVKKLASIELHCDLKEIRDSNKAFQVWKKTKGKEAWRELERIKAKNLELYDKFCQVYQMELKDKEAKTS
jgi:hypothetical protein